MNKVVTFIPDAGGSIISKNILSHKGKLRWCVREESANDVDNESMMLINRHLLILLSWVYERTLRIQYTDVTHP